MDTDNERPAPDLRLASFSERVLAFCLDAAPFVFGHWLTFGLMFPREASPAQCAIWYAFWTVLFLVSQAYFSCEGRVSLGKKLLEIRVLGREGEPLNLAQALIRTASYLVSSIFGLGFLWSLFEPSKRCWHDMPVGSVVIEERPKSPGGMRLARAGALACLGLLALAWTWSYVWEPRYHRIMTIAYAQAGLAEMAELQKTYRQQHGRYADNLFSLATVSVAPMNFLRDMSGLFDPEAGVSITATATGYTIAAKARDENRTMLRYAGS